MNLQVLNDFSLYVIFRLETSTIEDDVQQIHDAFAMNKDCTMMSTGHGYLAIATFRWGSSLKSVQ